MCGACVSMEKAHALVSGPPPTGAQKRKIRGRDHSAQLVELCFLSVVERFTSGGESSCRRRQLSSKISGLSGLLSISSTQPLVLLVFPRPSKGLVWESTQTRVGAGTRALLGPRVSASRRRALRGAAQGGADVVSRFPLLAPEARCGALRTPFSGVG